MASLNILSYQYAYDNGQLILEIKTNGNHGIKTDYVNILIAGASDNTYNGTFKFFIVNDTTLRYKQAIFEAKPYTREFANVLGTITANTIDYTILTAEVISTSANLYTITQTGNYQIELTVDNLYKIIYPQTENYTIKVGERLSDIDKIFYGNKPSGIYRAKWLIIEALKITDTLEIRLVIMN